MSYRWFRFPHFISRVSGPGGALSEGFASFWAWYSNEFYDGDNSAANDGPIYNFAGGASSNLETRAGGTYANGDHKWRATSLQCWAICSTPPMMVQQPDPPIA
jgi:hypothetical protein